MATVRAGAAHGVPPRAPLAGGGRWWDDGARVGALAAELGVPPRLLEALVGRQPQLLRQAVTPERLRQRCDELARALHVGNREVGWALGNHVPLGSGEPRAALDHPITLEGSHICTCWARAAWQHPGPAPP
jgi:hypothetical protein